MSDLQSLEANILAEIAAANDEAALEAVRVSALGKKGTVSALLATLGKLTPEERKSQGPLFNGLKERVTAAIGAASAIMNPIRAPGSTGSIGR